MRRLVLAVAFGSMSFAQAQVPLKEAIDITDADVKTVLKNAPPAVDQQLRVVDLGEYNLAVGIIHRGKTREGAAATGISHVQETRLISSFRAVAR